MTKYVPVGDADVAFQVLGHGPHDLLFSFGLGSSIEQFWDDPKTGDFLHRLASFSRLILFDRRGTGASDGVSRNALPTWEDWAEDIDAVLDAVGSERAVLLGMNDAGPIAVLYTATHPERVDGLVLCNTAARWMADSDYPTGATGEEVTAFVDLIRGQYGTPELAGLLLEKGADRPTAEWWARILRAAATPRTAAAQYDYVLRNLDVRQALPLIRIPTLILHVTEQPLNPLGHGRYLADHIAGARFVELPGRATLFTDESNRLIEEVAEFLTGERPVVEPHRILATVVFTDIVGSTERAASLGDHKWRPLLDAHDNAVRAQLRRFGGKEIKTTGDGFVASFDGPARAIRCATAVVDSVRELGLDLRVGIHTGECEVRGDDLGGIAMHIAARIASLAKPGEILASSTVKELVVGSAFEFGERGEHELKGVPGSWRLFAFNV